MTVPLTLISINKELKNNIQCKTFIRINDLIFKNDKIVYNKAFIPNDKLYTTNLLY